MTKYKTNAQKLKFFNDAKASRIAKAQEGIITKNPWEDPNIKVPSYEEALGFKPRIQSPVDSISTNTTKGQIPSYRVNPTQGQMYPRPVDPMLTNTTQGELRNPSRGGSRMSYNKQTGGPTTNRPWSATRNPDDMGSSSKTDAPWKSGIGAAYNIDPWESRDWGISEHDSNSRWKRKQPKSKKTGGSVKRKKRK